MSPFAPGQPRPELSIHTLCNPDGEGSRCQVVPASDVVMSSLLAPLGAPSATAKPVVALTKCTDASCGHGSVSCCQWAPPSVVRTSVFGPTAQPCSESMKSTPSKPGVAARSCNDQCAPSVVARTPSVPTTHPF